MFVYFIYVIISNTVSKPCFFFSFPESATDRDLQKVLQQLESHISFLEDLTKMGGAMRTVLTKILTNQQTFKELSMGRHVQLGKTF